MKNLFLILAFFFAIQLSAQDDDSYTMYQTILITPKSGHGQELRAGLKTHNEKFHKEGAQRVRVWSINSGPRFGSLLWVKGPLTWTDLDTPLEKDGHMDDWRANVAPHADLEAMEYWGLMDGLSYMPEDLSPTVVVMRYFDIKPRKWNNARDNWSQVLELCEEKKYDNGLMVYSNWANAGDGRDQLGVWYFENWAAMDKDQNFWDHYKEKYGIDRVEYFERWNEIADFKGMEILTLLPELSWSSPNDSKSSN